MSYTFVNKDHLGGNIYEGDPCTFSPSVWQYLVDRFAISSVLDLGSGRGHAANYFHKLGCKVIAVDGLVDNIVHSLYPTICVDLTKQFVYCRVDLVHCQEVVEHIDESFIHNLMTSLICGKIICMSHGIPGQQGYHHVNLQNSDYWITLFSKWGCKYLDIDSTRVRELALEDKAIHLAKSGLVFTNSWSQ